MSRAESFLKEWYLEYGGGVPKDLIKDWASSIKFAEAYHKSRINAISYKEIENKKFLMSDGLEVNNEAYKLGLQTGMKWLKNQIIKN